MLVFKGKSISNSVSEAMLVQQKDNMFRSAALRMLPYSGMLVLVAALAMLRASRIGRIDALSLLFDELVIAFGYIASVTDIKMKKIPNRVVLAMLASWALIMAPYVFVDAGMAIALIVESLLGLALGGGLFLLAYFISRKGLGGGDVKFMAAAGLFLGTGGAITTMLSGTILAALTGGAMMLLKKIGKKDTIPLAPFLFAGMLITVFFK